MYFVNNKLLIQNKFYSLNKIKFNIKQKKRDIFTYALNYFYFNYFIY